MKPFENLKKPRFTYCPKNNKPTSILSTGPNLGPFVIPLKNTRVRFSLSLFFFYVCTILKAPLIHIYRLPISRKDPAQVKSLTRGTHSDTGSQVVHMSTLTTLITGY